MIILCFPALAPCLRTPFPYSQQSSAFVLVHGLCCSVLTPACVHLFPCSVLTSSLCNPFPFSQQSTAVALVCHPSAVLHAGV